MPEAIISTVLGFDLGTKSTGAAVGQTITQRATPLSAIRSVQNKPDWSKIELLIEEWKPEALLVGLPLTMEGSNQPMSDKARRFSRQLNGRYNLPVELVDERLTTREAWLIAIDSGKKHNKGDIDSLSAALITESWLAQNS